jgi:signal transduction histidine kinase
VASERDISYPRHEPRPLPSYTSGGPSLALSAHRPRPPLTKRMRPWHWMAIDFVVGAVAGLSGMLATVQSVPVAAVQSGPVTVVQSVPLPVAALPPRLLLAAMIILPVGLRRRYPVPAFCALIVLAVLATAAGPASSSIILFAAAYVLYTVTVIRNKQTGVAALTFALAVITVTVILAHQHHGSDGAHVVAAFALIIAWMTGYSVRQRRLYAQMLQHEAASSAVAEERLRIARELHDVVAHSMSVIAVQAGYGQYVIDASPADARDALGAIQATSRDALEEMRRMLGVLRQQDAAPARERPHSAPLAPAPGLGDLERLIQRTRGAGVEVSLERSGRVRAVPAGVDLSAYRIIQEALTNVVKHAGGGARCTVSLGYGETVLEVRVADDGGRPLVLAGNVPVTAGTGHGLIGMRERTHLCGGEFNAGPLADGGFQVAATLPLLGGAPPERPVGSVPDGSGS